MVAILHAEVIETRAEEDDGEGVVRYEKFVVDYIKATHERIPNGAGLGSVSIGNDFG